MVLSCVGHASDIFMRFFFCAHIICLSKLRYVPILNMFVFTYEIKTKSGPKIQ